MPVPDEIKKVKRPKNTIVKFSANNKYIVIERTGCKYVNGRRLPVNGKTIGYIIEGKYVAKEATDLNSLNVEFKDYALPVFCNNMNKDLFEDLLNIFSVNDAKKIYCTALLRAINPGLCDRDLSFEYDTSYLSEIYSDAKLSKNTISEFQELLGMNYSKLITYMQGRINKAKGHNIAIDGMLKSNNSKINDFSEFSRKGRIKSSKDISIIYAFDTKKKEPIYQKIVPGNMLDSTAFKGFIDESEVKDGIIIGDKGFFNKKELEELSSNKDVHYLIPIKRSTKYLKDIECYKDYELLNYNDKEILGKRIEKNNHFYYSFKDIDKANKEEKDYLKRSKKKKEYDEKKYTSKKEVFGTIVYESDYKLELNEAFDMYKSRWEIELMFNQYKNMNDLTKTGVHNDYSIIGKEFINYIATIMTCRMRDAIDRVKLFEKYSFKQILRLLSKVKVYRVNNKEWQKGITIKYIIEIEKLLGIV